MLMERLYLFSASRKQANATILIVPLIVIAPDP